MAEHQDRRDSLTSQSNFEKATTRIVILISRQGWSSQTALDDGLQLAYRTAAGVHFKLDTFRLIVVVIVDLIAIVCLMILCSWWILDSGRYFQADVEHLVDSNYLTNLDRDPPSSLLAARQCRVHEPKSMPASCVVRCVPRRR